MKQIAIGFLAATGLVAIMAAAPKVYVTNPLSADVLGAHFSVVDVAGVSAHDVGVLNETHAVAVGLAAMVGTDQGGGGPIPSARGRVLLGDGGYPFFGYPSITALTFDPSVVGVDLDAGSLALRRVNASTGELWFKFGPNATDWQQIGG